MTIFVRMSQVSNDYNDNIHIHHFTYIYLTPLLGTFHTKYTVFTCYITKLVLSSDENTSA